MNRILTYIVAVFLFTLAPLTEALACAVCRPDPLDPISRAADMSVLFLGALVMGIIGLFSSFFIYLWYRNRNPLLDPAALIAEGDAHLDSGSTQ